ADRCPRWGGAAHPRERHAAWSPRGLGRATGETDSALHGDAARHALHSRHPNVLRTPPDSGQSEAGGLGRLQAQAADHRQRHAQTPDSLAGSGGLSLPGRGISAVTVALLSLWARCLQAETRRRRLAMSKVRPATPTVAFVDQ